jgi:hypothetical protein
MGNSKKGRICLICGVDISHKDGKAKFCNKEHSNLYFKNKKKFDNFEYKKGKKCKLCGIDISHKIKSAQFCCRGHKSKYYKANNREKVNEWKRDWQKKNLKSILESRRLEKIKEVEIYGFTKSYLRTYAKRHINDLIKLKGKKCFKCGRKDFLEIHHTKYDKNPENWEFVCLNCHILIHEPTALIN